MPVLERGNPGIRRRPMTCKNRLPKWLICLALSALLLGAVISCGSDTSLSAPAREIPSSSGAQTDKTTPSFSAPAREASLPSSSQTDGTITPSAAPAREATLPCCPQAGKSSALLSASAQEAPLSIGFQTDKPNALPSASSRKASAVPEGYRSVCFDGTAFVAVGTGGRIDRIAPDKTVAALLSATDACLNGVVSVNGIDVAVGERGVILVAKTGGNFRAANSGTDSTLYGVTLFRNAFWAAGAGGVLLHSPDGEHWTLLQTKTKNDIRSISANNRMCMAVTGEGQILTSTDGENWNILDYNKVYKGYAEPYRFHSVRACGDVFFLAGEYQKDPGIPVVLSSDTGEVWAAHPMTKVNGEPLDDFLPLTVNAVGLDWDQIVAVCNGGKLLVLTECSVCNKLTGLTDRNINDLAFAEGQVAAVGDGFWFDILKNETFRQYKIPPEQAREDFRNGACVVDVRTAEEYEASHIPGCVHIPVDRIGNALEAAIPDKSREIIFYCAGGVRAQKALEEALRMGYKKVYNLGGISDWLYEK